ncbi:MAG: cupredoxin domain-containing protein [Candidatus Baltobacteraceae bacterium]
MRAGAAVSYFIAVLFIATAFTGSVRAGDGIVITAVPSSFTPNKIVLHAGQTTTLHFEKTEGVHSIASQELGIRSTILTPGKNVDIDVTPAKTGTFVVHCGIVCGTDHESMALTVVVNS